jgi:hypothetical protein
MMQPDTIYIVLTISGKYIYNSTKENIYTYIFDRIDRNHLTLPSNTIIDNLYDKLGTR